MERCTWESGSMGRSMVKGSRGGQIARYIQDSGRIIWLMEKGSWYTQMGIPMKETG